MKVYNESNPYPNKWYRYVDDLTSFVMRHGSLNPTISCFIWTTEELKTPWRKYLYAALWIPVNLLIFIAFLSISVISFIVWACIQHKRKPYRYVEGYVKRPPTPKPVYSFGTANVCLLAEFLSRFNNLSDNKGRAQEIGKRIREGQTELNSSIYEKIKYNNITRNANDNEVSSFDHAILTRFPPVDVLFIQEAWVPFCCRELIKHLISRFPYIVYDVGKNSWKDNKFQNNSGLLIASRYPIMDLDFSCYRSKCYPCNFASKGLLQIKVSRMLFTCAF